MPKRPRLLIPALGTGLLFVIWTFANLGPRAKSLTAKYEEEFGEEYKKLHKKYLIPFIW